MSEFDRMFAPTTDNVSITVINPREFVAFFNVIRCFSEDVTFIQNNRSSSLKSTAFLSYFMHPPFFSCPSPTTVIEYQEYAHLRCFVHRFSFLILLFRQLSWKFPMFISARSGEYDAVNKYKPSNDFGVIHSNFGIPFVVGEIISKPKEEDRYRMLVQAIAQARTGDYLMKPGSEMQFFIIAIYVTASMKVERYIVTKDNMSQNHRKVCSNNYT